MPNLLLTAIAMPLLTGLALHAQPPESLRMMIDRSAAPKINDLVHTRLEVRFDYKKRYLYGKEWVTIKPHFEPTDTLRLDAKGMDIHRVSLLKKTGATPAQFAYDGLTLTVALDKVYRNNERYTVFIDYTAKPNELKFEDSSLAKFNRG
jgi:aminopeptidase N